MNVRHTLWLIAAVSLVGCASQGGYTPTVDARMDENPETYQRDLQECRELALQASETATEAVKGGVVGGLLGAATGAAVGAAVGDPGAGAAIGAAVGGVGGATKQGVEAEDQYKTAYNNCMKGRGHPVIN